MRSITTEVEIEATPEEVWAMLVAVDEFAGWNPFMIEAAGPVALGHRLQVVIRPPGGSAKTFKPTVTVCEPNRVLEWLGRVGMPGLFDGRHRFVVEMRNGSTYLVHSEEFRGVLVPLIFSSMEAKTKSGFEAMNAALKVRVKNLARTMP